MYPLEVTNAENVITANYQFQLTLKRCSQTIYIPLHF